MDENIKNICLFGQYYNPADKHYGKDCDVICDKCFRHNLDVSIGWETYDLCLECVQSVNKYLKKESKCTDEKNDKQNIFNEKDLPRKDVKRLMMQRQFTKK